MYLTSISIAQTNTHISNSLTSDSGSIAPQACHGPYNHLYKKTTVEIQNSQLKTQNKDCTIIYKMVTKTCQHPMEKVHYTSALQHFIILHITASVKQSSKSRCHLTMQVLCESMDPSVKKKKAKNAS